ncbi:hypothetical protein ABBQ32_001509 [Trebouxia sp. C0010 RCD-2024]
MVANEAALILKYFGRAVSVGSKPVQEGAYKVFSPGAVASTWERASQAPKRPLLLAQAELNNDANRMQAFQQMQDAGSNSKAPAPSQPTYTQSFSDNSRSINQDTRYREAGQTLRMMEN